MTRDEQKTFLVSKIEELQKEMDKADDNFMEKQNFESHLEIELLQVQLHYLQEQFDKIVAAEMVQQDREKYENERFI